MHRSSESVAAIATALAKAQTELSNPEKAMVGTIYNNRSDSPQSFRYASLSSGLDIIRKTLGGQQIAITQTTDIDRANGTVNLTAASTGAYAGMVVFQSRDNTQALTLSGNNLTGISGSVYAANAALTMSGNAKLKDALVIGTINLSGNTIFNTVSLSAPRR